MRREASARAALRSAAAASAKRSRSRSLRVSTRSRRPVSGSTSHSSPTSGSSCSRGSRISTATTSCRPASSSSGRAASPAGPRKSETTATSARCRAAAADAAEGLARTRSSPALGLARSSRSAVSSPSRPARPCRGGSVCGLGVAERSRRRAGCRAASPRARRERGTLGDVRLAAVGRAEAHRRRRVEHEPGRHHPLGEVDAHVRHAACARSRSSRCGGRRRPARTGAPARARVPMPSSVER